jgi:hypothetical protein
MCFNGTTNRNEEYPIRHYEQFLRHVQETYGGKYWHVLPRDLARFWMRMGLDDEHDARALRSLQLEYPDCQREAEKQNK